MWRGFLHRRLVHIFAVFLVSYVLSFFAWMAVKNAYGCFVSGFSTYMLAAVCDVKVKGISCSGEKSVSEVVRVGYAKGKLGEMRVKFPLKVSLYTYNVPITVACVVTFFFAFGFKLVRIFEVVLLLVFVHSFYVFSYERLHLIYMDLKSGMFFHSGTEKLVWEFLWFFWRGMVLRFEPFLVVCYLYFKESIGGGK